MSGPVVSVVNRTYICIVMITLSILLMAVGLTMNIIYTAFFMQSCLTGAMNARDLLRALAHGCVAALGVFIYQHHLS